MRTAPPKRPADATQPVASVCAFRDPDVITRGEGLKAIHTCVSLEFIPVTGEGDVFQIGLTRYQATMLLSELAASLGLEGRPDD